MFDGIPTMSAIIAGVTPWISPLWTEFDTLLYMILGFAFFGAAFWLIIKLGRSIFGDH